ncbi:MAG: hypothetical protein ABSF86_17175, partial [Steroidobacteraceae bacterium]
MQLFRPSSLTACPNCTTSAPALKILDVTLAMNLGWAKIRDACARLIIYQTLHDSPKEPIYHPTLVGDAPAVQCSPRRY